MLLSALALSIVPAVENSSAPVTVDLTFKPYKDWNILLPNEQFAKLGEGVLFDHAGGNRFAAKLEGTVLWLDRNGDGECEAKVEPFEPGQTGLMVFRAPNEDGSEGQYAVRLSSDGAWSYSASCAMVGTLEGERIQLIDQNNNGRFDDIGEDAMIIGRGKAASFLSSIANVGGKLVHINVSADGSRILATPFEGEIGSIDLASELDCKARMRSVVLKSENGDHSFEVSQAKGAFKVPAGKYTIYSGQVALGKGRADLKTGRMQTVEITAGETTKLAWGGPVEAEFLYHRKGDEITIAPNEIYYYGRRGEQYSNFMPLGSSPNFAVKDAETGEVLVNAKFPGNC